MRDTTLAAFGLSFMAFAAVGLAADPPAKQPGTRQRAARQDAAKGGASDADQLKDARSYVYKKVGGAELKLYVFQPAEGVGAAPRPAIVFFFGGGWMNGSPTQFVNQSKYLASRGMVAIVADYRVKSRNDSTVEQSTADALSAVRWVRGHSSELGIDPKRIAAGGGSAGGHLAAATGTLEGADEPGEDTSVSARPNAMVLFNPALVLPSLAAIKASGDKKDLSSRFSGDPQKMSPADHVRPGQAPSIIFHGKADTTVDIATAEKFRDAAVKAGNRCELVAFEGQGHGFFNWNRKDKQAFAETLEKTDRFLASLGWLSGPPTVT
ncbi:MAG TPA: alpha/beta hydrolase, partial [Caulifigura sp.]|nr:alpha/beta hydrolase [Caulifigura sp.]